MNAVIKSSLCDIFNMKYSLNIREKISSQQLNIKPEARKEVGVYDTSLSVITAHTRYSKLNS